MTFTHRLILFVPAALMAAPLALAQPAQPVGVAHLQHVTGNVLVSRETGLASGNEATVLTKGSRVITTANSEVTVVYDNGCEVKLKPNQRFEVKDKQCKELVASVESIGVEPSTAIAANGATEPVSSLGIGSAGGFGISAGTVAIIGGGLAGLAALERNRESQAVSPH